MKASAVNAAPTLKVAITGPSGSGKTTWMARSPFPLMIMFERQGIASVRAVAPQTPVILVDGYNDFCNIMNELAAAPMHPDVPGAIAVEMDGQTIPAVTLCIDSFTAMAQSMFLTLLRSKAGQQYTPADIEAGRIQVSQDDYGRIGRALLEMMRVVRDFPISVICSFLPTTDVDQARNKHVKVDLPGKMAADKCISHFNAAGYAYRRRGAGADDTAIEHLIMWSHPSERYPCKRMMNWPATTINTNTPGQTTLGSLMLAAFGDDCGATVMPGDSAGWATAPDDRIEDAVTVPITPEMIAPVEPAGTDADADASMQNTTSNSPATVAPSRGAAVAPTRGLAAPTR